MGWNFHRIWSTDWFRNPQQEITRAVAAIEAARKSLSERRDIIVPECTPQARHEIIRGQPAEEKLSNSNRPYVKVRLTPVIDTALQLHQEKPEKLVQMIKTVIDIEAPVHESDITRRLMDAFGVGRAGARITSAVETAIREGCRHQLFRHQDGFVYASGNTTVKIRNRSQLEAAERKIELVAPEELDLAITETVTLGFSMTVEESISGALALIGFGRATAKISAILEGRVQKLLASGGLTEVSGLILCHVSPVQSSRIDGLEEVRGIATEASAQVTFR